MENLRNQSGGSGTSGHSLKRQPKYGHVKSKVKQFIDEAISQRGRHVLVRHKSMPESNNSRGTEEVWWFFFFKCGVLGGFNELLLFTAE